MISFSVNCDHVFLEATIFKVAQTLPEICSNLKLDQSMGVERLFFQLRAKFSKGGERTI